MAKLKLVDNWRTAHRWYSMHVAAAIVIAAAACCERGGCNNGQHHMATGSYERRTQCKDIAAHIALRRVGHIGPWFEKPKVCKA